MIESEYRNLLTDGNIHKSVNIIFDNNEKFENEDIYVSGMEISEMICEKGALRFGRCCSSCFKIQIDNRFSSHKGMRFTVAMTLDNDDKKLFLLGRYKVVSETPTADRRLCNIEAYDAMHDIIHADVSGWYNSLLPEKDGHVTMKQFRTSFMEHFGIVQQDIALVNDNMVITRTIEPDTLSGSDVITSICEINGCFGNIGRDGTFRYVVLRPIIDGLYPSNDLYPGDNVFPRSPSGAETLRREHYISCRYEDFVTKRIDKLQIRGDENDIGCIYGDGDNCYTVQNFLLYGKGEDELRGIAANMYEVIKDITYRPAEVEAVGNPCIEVGDGISLSTDREIVSTYVLSRTLKGVQALRDTYSAEGTEYYAEKVNDVNTQIMQLRGRTNRFIRTVDETRSKMEDMDSGLRSEISQTAEKITQEMDDRDRNMSSRVEKTAERINSEVSRAKGVEENLYTNLLQTAEMVMFEAERAQGVEENLSGRIELKPDNINLQIENGQYSAGIKILWTENGEQKEVKGTIAMTGVVTFFDLENAGHTSISGDNIRTGTINGVVFISRNENGQEVTIKDGHILLENGGDQRFITIKDGTYELGISAHHIILGEGTSISDIAIDTKRVNAISFYMDGNLVATREWISKEGYLKEVSRGNDETGSGSRFVHSITKENGGIKYHVMSMSTSDGRLKTKVKDLPDISGAYMAFRPKKYRFMSDLKGYSGRWQYGLIAQETLETLRKNGLNDDALVWMEEADADFREDKYCEDGKIWKLDKDQLHAMHIQMIQSLKIQVDDLKSDIRKIKEALCIE